MNIEDQVISLDLAKQLKELNVKQESLFYWSICHHCVEEYPAGTVEWELSHGKCHGENISAFTSSELGKMLPWAILKGGRQYFLTQAKSGNDFIIIYQTLKHDDLFYPENKVGVNEANIRAEMLIYLIEKDLLNKTKIEEL